MDEVMGYQIESVSQEILVRLSRHNDERDDRHDALAEELRAVLESMTGAILSSGKYDEILTDAPERREANTAVIADDVVISLTCNDGELLRLPLRMAALIAAVSAGELMPFVYDRCVPDEDETHVADHRMARLMIIDDGPLVLPAQG